MSTEPQHPSRSGRPRPAPIPGQDPVDEGSEPGSPSLAAARRDVVRRAEDLIRSRPDAALTARELAQALGVSVRSLFRAFEETRGYGPKEARIRARLAHVRSDLLSADPGVTVTEVAHNWGFVHLGRFAAVYRRHFGEKPSDTLRAAIAADGPFMR